MLTAFIPTFNSERTLQETIQSIKSQSIPPKKIIVIDSGSTDNTEKIANKEGVEFYSPEYFGFKFLGLGRARNRILNLIDTPYLLSVDSDVVLEKDYIKKLLPVIDGNNELAGIAGKQIEFNRIFIPDKLRATIEMRDLYFPLKEQKREYRDFLLGSNNIYKVDCLHSISSYPFNDNLTTNYEDVDIGEKLRRKGYKLLWIPDVLTFHLQKDNLFSFINRAYRYRVFKWKLKGAFKDLDIYKGKIEHNINYTKMGFNIAIEKKRFYLLYPYFLIGFYFFLKDAEIFQQKNQYNIANSIISSFFKAVDDLKNIELKEFLLNDIAKIIKFEKVNIRSISNEIDEWFYNLINFKILKDLYESDDKCFEKLLLLSRKRIDFENNLKIFNNEKILILNLDCAGNLNNYSNSIYHTFCQDKKLIEFYVELQKKNIASWITNAFFENYNEDEIFYEVMCYKPDKIYIKGNIDKFLKEKINSNLKGVKFYNV